MPEGTLRRVLCYPLDANGISSNRLTEILARAGLSGLATELDMDAPWSQRLSPGDLQRLSLARALLLAPAWLFLDEATSSLDATAELELYTMLKTELSGTTLVSITHRKDVARMHDRVLCLTLHGLVA